MGKLRVSAPVYWDSLTYAYRDTGGSWSGENTLNRGAYAPTRNFVSPQCDELRITATSAAPVTVDRVHMCGVTPLTGLSFEYAADGNVDTIPQNAPVNRFPRARQTLRVTESTDTVHVLTITGIDQGNLNFLDFMFAATEWVPPRNFEDNSSRQVMPLLVNTATIQSEYMRTKQARRSMSAVFNILPTPSYLLLEDLILYGLQNYTALVELDDESDDPRDSYIGNLSIVGDVAPDTQTTTNVVIRLGEKHTP